MHKQMVLSLFVAISCLSSLTLGAISIQNDLHYLVEADPQYAGFKDAPVYVNGHLIPVDGTLYLGNTGDYIIEVEVPADFAAQQLGGQTLSTLRKAFYRLLRCYLQIHFKPDNPDQQHFYITEIALDKIGVWEQNKPTITIVWRGLHELRSVTAYIKDNE